MNKIKVITFGSSLHGQEEQLQLKQRFFSEIESAGDLSIEEVRAPSVEGVVAVVVLTGGVEREALKLVSLLPSPVLLIAYSGHNALPAALEILARIRQDGGEGRILFGSPQEIATGLCRELRVTSAWEALRFARVGLIGDPSDWLVASNVEPAFLKGRMGIDLVKIEIDELLEKISSVSPSRKEISQLVKQTREVREPSKDELRGAVAIYAGLRALVEEHRLTACSIRCFDLIASLRNTACYALSRLNSEHIPAGCEGDLQALFSLYLGYLISEASAFMGNISLIDSTHRRITLAHCACPLSLASSCILRSHFESGLGVGIAADIPEGPCTLFRLGGARLNKLFVREGRIQNAPVREDLCRTQVTVSISEPIDQLLRAPLGNHHILILGYHREVIEGLFDRFLRT